MASTPLVTCRSVLFDVKTTYFYYFIYLLFIIFILFLYDFHLIFSYFVFLSKFRVGSAFYIHPGMSLWFSARLGNIWLQPAIKRRYFSVSIWRTLKKDFMRSGICSSSVKDIEQLPLEVRNEVIINRLSDFLSQSCRFFVGVNRAKICRDISLPHTSRFFVATNRV